MAISLNCQTRGGLNDVRIVTALTTLTRLFSVATPLSP